MTAFNMLGSADGEGIYDLLYNAELEMADLKEISPLPLPLDFRQYLREVLQTGAAVDLVLKHLRYEPYSQPLLLFCLLQKRNTYCGL